MVYRKDLLVIRRKMAWDLLFGIVALNLGTVCISVEINAWNRRFYNALQAFDRGEIFRQLGLFLILGSLGIALSVCAFYLQPLSSHRDSKRLL